MLKVVRNLFLFIVCTMLLTINQISAEVISKDIIHKINEGVFEVVVPKVGQGELKYEKELPFHALPYAERTDKFHSTGSAFLFKDNLILTAAHVLRLHKKSHFNEIYIRDNDKNVYEIDKIIAYSYHRDFVLFTVKNKKFKSPFKLNITPELNEEVYAVGNALGEGVVIRKGTFTSQTPEEFDGKWQWLRFSAAASPGNSGGPLLDTQGNIIGVVLKKSPNENLNYALPITEVINGMKNKADIKMKLIFKLSNSTNRISDTYQNQFNLPKTVLEVRKDISSDFKKYYQEKMRQLLKVNKKKFFPNGDKSLELLYQQSYPASFLNIIGENEYGSWILYTPKDIRRIPIGNNGFVAFGNTSSDRLFTYLQRPDNVSVKELCEDSEKYMDLMLRALYLFRQVGSERIKITSLGKAFESEVYIDKYNRKWLVREWLMKFSDQKVTMISLPTPHGMVSLASFGYTGNYEDIDLKILTDFATVNYRGTFYEWDAFLENKEYLPKILQDLTFKFRPSNIQFETPYHDISYTRAFMPISTKSVLDIGFTFRRKKDSVVLDFTRVTFIENKHVRNFISILKRVEPVSGLRDKFFAEWDRIVNKKYPYNEEIIKEKGYTQIYTTKLYNAKKHQKAVTFKLNLEGDLKADYMKKKLKEFKQNTYLKIEE